jgi:DNA-binding response OmpR family regulator
MVTTDCSTGSKSVFLVDDDLSTVSLYSNRLEQAGFKTASAADAKAACAALPELCADLFIVDLMLPKRGGFELLEAIRSDRRHRDTPVLVLSNAYFPEMAQKALRSGGNKALPRSECTSSELISISRELVGGMENAGAARTNEGPAAADLTERLKQALLEEGSSEVFALQQDCLRYADVAGSAEGKEVLDKLYQGIRFLSSRAGLAGCRNIAQLTGAIEAMMFDQVLRSNGGMSPSSIQTLIRAVECLGRLFDNRDSGASVSSCKAKVLLVDDDQVCNMANEVALKRANYNALSATNGSAGLNLLNEHAVDLILLDIDMPGMNGIEMCQRLRNIPQHKNTPVIFVTLHGDFENRAKTVLSGGDDLISKPISPLELIVKATVFLLGNARLQASPEPSLENGAQPQSLTNQTSEAGGPPKGDKFQASVKERFKFLKEALAEETKRREAVEQQAAENAKRRAELEAAIEENQRSQQMFQKLLEESQQQIAASGPGGGGGQVVNLAGRRRALVEVGDFVADKLIKLKRALEEETKRRDAVELQIAENASRRTELEAALGESLRVQAAFQHELESTDNPKQVLELESSLAESEMTRGSLIAELEAARRELETLRGQATKESAEHSAAEQSKLEARIQEMQAAHADAEQQIKTLKEALTVETERREALKRRAAENMPSAGANSKRPWPKTSRPSEPCNGRWRLPRMPSGGASWKPNWRRANRRRRGCARSWTKRRNN